MADKPQVLDSEFKIGPKDGMLDGYYETVPRDWLPEDGLTVRRVAGGFVLNVGDQSRLCADIEGLHALLTSFMG